MTDNRATARLSSVRLGSELAYAINTQERPIIIFMYTQLHTDTLDYAHVVVCLLLSSGIQLQLIRGHLTLSLLSPRCDMIVCQAESELINKYEP